MKGSEERLVRFMEGSKKRFVIPVYQRNYDWKTEHCKQLYDDLVKVARQDRKNHFFGSIVSVYNPDGHQDEFLIIDGQQRLTTTSLLLLAMYNLIQQGTIVPQSTHLGQQIYEDYLVDKWQPQETRIKLKPIKNDQKAFGRLFNEDDENIADSNLTINYAYFYDRIQKNEISIDALFESMSRLEIINITLNQDDNPQLIFESLNSTGMELSEGDKIRNYILMGLPGAQQELYYDKYWNKIESCTAYDVSSFVRDYLSIKQQSTPNIKNVYFTFKDFVERSEISAIEDLLSDLLNYAKKYEYLLAANSPLDKVNGCIYRLNRIKTTVTRPFLMEVFRMFENGKISDDDLYEIFKVVENYVFRRNICEIPTNALNKIFLMLHREIVRFDGSDEEYFEKFKYAIMNKKESGRFPGDEEFLEALASKNIYGMRGESKLYLFERMENAGTIETKNVWEHLDKGEYSIEHVMPQHLTTVWTDELGEDYERIHLSWLHRLANLTLTGYNSKYSNRPFLEKRDMENGFVQSGLRLNQWIAQREKWGEAELERRSDILLRRALKIWPCVEVNYNPPIGQADMVTLDDDVIFTGKTISKFSLMGMEQIANSWVNMYQLVLMQLHAKDKSVLMQLAVCDDPTVDLALHFSTNKTSYTAYREIDTNLFVWTGTDTQYKINLLKKVFSMFDVDPSELVFYLSVDEENGTEDITRYQTRQKYWTYALPILKQETVFFNNVNPVQSNSLTVTLGISGIPIVCVANFDSARVELYLSLPTKEQNKTLFDFLYNQKDTIEAAAGKPIVWQRNDDVRISKIYLKLSDVNIGNEANWPRMAKFHAEATNTISDIFKPVLMKYFE